MSGRTAKRLRREALANGILIKPKQYFKPYMIPMPDGKIDEEGNQGTVLTYFPRRTRRKAFRMMMTDLRKGRLNDRRPQEKRQSI